MRYPEKLKALLVLDILLVLAIAAGTALSAGARSARASRGRLLDADPELVAAVEISRPFGTQVFRRHGGAWILESPGGSLPARAERVDAFLDAVGSVRALQEAGRSESAWESLGLGGSSSRRVRLLSRDGSARADFRVGRYTPEGSRVFVRREGEIRSYSVPASLASRLPASRTAWLDLRLLGEPVPLEDVQRLRVAGFLEYGPREAYRADFTLTRSAERGWTSGEIPDLDPSAAERFVRALMYLEGEDYSPENRFPDGAEGLRIELELGGGTLRTLQIAGRTDGSGMYTASRTGTRLVLRVDVRRIRDALRTPSDLTRKDAR